MAQLQRSRSLDGHAPSTPDDGAREEEPAAVLRPVGVNIFQNQSTAVIAASPASSSVGRSWLHRAIHLHMRSQTAERKRLPAATVTAARTFLLPGEPAEQILTLPGSAEGAASSLLLPPFAQSSGDGQLRASGTLVAGGVLLLTTYRVLFVHGWQQSERQCARSSSATPAPPQQHRAVSLPLLSILRLSHCSERVSHDTFKARQRDCDGQPGSPELDTLQLETKNGRTVTFLFDAGLFGEESDTISNSTVRRHLDDGQKAGSNFVKALERRLVDLAFGKAVPFAYQYRPAVDAKAATANEYIASEELERIGVAESGLWRISDLNKDWSLCRTYPAALAVPILADEETLRGSAAFRSKHRLPVLSWLDRHSHAAILRCAQPLVGLLGHHSRDDERLLELCCASNIFCSELLLLDARPYKNAAANKGRRGGFEDASKYVRKCGRGDGSAKVAWSTRLHFLDIDNIHTMRASLQQLQKLFYDAAGGSWGRGSKSETKYLMPAGVELREMLDGGWIGGGSQLMGPKWSHAVESTGWLGHVGRVLAGATAVAMAVAERRQTVVVHCSDGWDRTAQLVSLAMLLLDPYYRTLDGFATLIEKEWIGFGHQFKERLGKFEIDCASVDSKTGVDDAHSKQNERSPVFTQFLDCVYQLQLQFPEAFEYNEAALLYLHHHCHSGLFGNFLYNSERERTLDAGQHRTASIWSALKADRHLYTNARHCADGLSGDGHERVLLPRLGHPYLQIWRNSFCRWYDDPWEGSRCHGGLLGATSNS